MVLVFFLICESFDLIVPLRHSELNLENSERSGLDKCLEYLCIQDMGPHILSSFDGFPLRRLFLKKFLLKRHSLLY